MNTSLGEASNMLLLEQHHMELLCGWWTWESHMYQRSYLRSIWRRLARVTQPKPTICSAITATTSAMRLCSSWWGPPFQTTSYNSLMKSWTAQRVLWYVSYSSPHLSDPGSLIPCSVFHEIVLACFLLLLKYLLFLPFRGPCFYAIISYIVVLLLM